MKKSAIYLFLLPVLAFFWGCTKLDTYPGGDIAPYIALFDVRNMYKGKDVVLTKENMFGSDRIAVTVISDFRAGNMVPGLLIVQDRRRLNILRGIAIATEEAANYVAGDSLVIKVEGATLTKVNGMLQITGVKKDDIKKAASNITFPLNRATTAQLVANPQIYESTLLVVVKGGFDPLPQPGDVLSGNKVLNDGFDYIKVRTEPGAAFANTQLPVMANIYGIAFYTEGADGKPVPELRMRSAEDMVPLSSTIEVAPILVTGFLADPTILNDGGYEYMQFMATRDIDFAVTPFSIVTSNNANASTPTGFLPNGWATGSVRSYKMNLTSGKVTKGSIFYVGGPRKMINGDASTSIAEANWIKAYDYVALNGEGFGSKTGNLLANSGNASGIAVFTGTTVTGTSRPVDVIWVGTGGSLYSAGPPAIGYRITNTDWYDLKNPITQQDQPFYRSGTNTLNLAYTTEGQWYMLGGEYNVSLGRWTKLRAQNNKLLTKTSTLAEIEGEGTTKLKLP